MQATKQRQAPGKRGFQHAARKVTVRQLVASPSRARLFFGPVSWLVELGHAGVIVRKREGDRGTPAGRLRLVKGYYRRDRERRPGGNVPWQATTPRDAWCDVAGDRHYNRPVVLPYPVIDERLWRDDNLYDLCLTTDYNQRPRKRGAGSAIFIHVARGSSDRLATTPQPTAGCIAMPVDRLRWLMGRLGGGLSRERESRAAIEVFTRQCTPARKTARRP